MDFPKIDGLRSGDVSPYTPFTKFCLSTLPPLSNFTARAEEAQVDAKPEEKRVEEEKEKEKEKERPEPCGCSRTKCLKLYCECFRNNLLCDGCHCRNCKNKAEYEEIRERAIQITKERNPAAFREDISETYKACHCKRSGCKKKYCECFEAGKICTAHCKCEGCKNLPEATN